MFANMTYNQVHQMFRSGVISFEQWNAYCLERLHDVLMQNIDVLIRLKDR